MNFVKIGMVVWLLIFTHTTMASVETGKIKSLIVSADSNKTALIVFDTVNPAFISACGADRRVKFDKTNKEVYALILSLYMAGKDVGFYYNPTGNTLSFVGGTV